MTVVASGCTFDSNKLAERACGTGGSCPSGQTCCSGFCIVGTSCFEAGTVLDSGDGSSGDVAPDVIDPSKDKDFDGVDDDKDNCPDVANASQADGDKDKIGDACDCAPDDPDFGPTRVDIKTFSDAQGFAGIDDPASWKVVGRTYQQQTADGVQRARHNVGDANAIFARAVVAILADGDDLLDLADKEEVAWAGIVARMANVSAGAGDGYYCGIDRKGQRLLMARTSGNELKTKTMTLFGDPFTKPGRIISKGIRIDQPYTVTMRVKDSTITCEVLLSDFSRFELKETDTTITRGGVGLFTMGAKAQFESFRVCGNN